MHAILFKEIFMLGKRGVTVNVYAPRDTAAKNIMWDWLTPYMLNKNDSCLCVCGDFNSVRSSDDRKCRAFVFRQADADMFNKFIDDTMLIDFPICGRLFTWYRGDGVTMSRLDRFLLS